MQLSCRASLAYLALQQGDPASCFFICQYSKHMGQVGSSQVPAAESGTRPPTEPPASCRFGSQSWEGHAAERYTHVCALLARYEAEAACLLGQEHHGVHVMESHTTYLEEAYQVRAVARPFLMHGIVAPTSFCCVCGHCRSSLARFHSRRVNKPHGNVYPCLQAVVSVRYALHGGSRRNPPFTLTCSLKVCSGNPVWSKDNAIG
jgi:hypothetical protein